MVTTGAEEDEGEEGKCAWIFNVSDAAPAPVTRADLLPETVASEVPFCVSLKTISKLAFVV